MFYARWSKDHEMKNILKKIDFNQEITSSGTPITHEKNNLYDARISFAFEATKSYLLSFKSPILITISISSAPFFTASSVS